jgi:hypothetical protein
MDERTARLEAIVADLTGRVADLEARIRGAETTRAIPSADLHDPIASAVAKGAGSLQQWVALLGRTLVVLGGAYLLRAITESQVVSPQTGVLVGLLYGAPWLVLASRAEGRGAHLDALSHALSTALIGYPLVWEATVRFQVLTPAQSAGVIAALTGAALVLASRRRLQSLAWIVTFGGLASAFGLAVATATWVPYTLVTIAVGLATLWLAYLHRWNEMRWPAAFAANLMLFVATGRAGAHGGAAAVMWLQALALAGYFGSFTLRIIVGSSRLTLFEVAQAAAALVVAFGGLVYLAAGSSSGLLMLAAGSIGFGVAAYAVAFAFTETHRPASTFLFQTTVAFFFCAVSIAVGFGTATSAALYVMLAAIALAAALKYRRSTLALHATLYAITAALAAGLFNSSAGAFAAPGPAGVLMPSPSSAAALATLFAITALPVREPRERWRYVIPVSRCIGAAIAVWGSAAALVAMVVAAFAGNVDGSQLSTIRTIVLAIAALTTASAGFSRFGREAGWLTYPLLMIAGLKLVFVDFARGRPTTLFAALAAYGAALILAPRILRRVAARREQAASKDAALPSEPMSCGVQTPAIVEAVGLGLQTPTIVEAVDRGLQTPATVEAVGRGLQTPAITSTHPQTTAR